MKKLSKILILVVSAALLVTASVLGTLAYLTNTTEKVTNTFTIGNVKISLDETDVDLNGVKEGDTRVTGNEYKLIPSREYIKDPIIHVEEGSEACWVFIALKNGLGDAATFSFNGDMWDEIGETEAGVIYAYKTTLSAGESTKALFETFTFDGSANPADYEDATIDLIGYAVQAEGFESAEAAWAAGFGNN